MLGQADGTNTTYTYDAGSRLTGLNLNGGPANSYTFGYNLAGQITSRTSSNNAFAWNGAVNANRAYINNLNQYTASGSVTPTYDARGNLTSAGSDTYGYNTRNQLYTKGSGTLFYRNPAGTLSQVIASNAVSGWDYVGDKLAIEIDGNTGAIQRADG